MNGRQILLIVSLMWIAAFTQVNAQSDSGLPVVEIHAIESKVLDQQRHYWVALPENYADSKTYPVVYVLDAEWRFDLVRAILTSKSSIRNLPEHIIVGIPHVSPDQRSRDLTFGVTRIRPDGLEMDSVRNHAGNTGGGMTFFHYLNRELIPRINETYAANGHNILIGHSYGGLFGAYIMPFDHAFSAFLLIDPSAWYQGGFLNNHLKNNLPAGYATNLFIGCHTDTHYHAAKVRELISRFETYPAIRMAHQEYPDETHGSIYLPALIDGLKFLYGKSSSLSNFREH